MIHRDLNQELKEKFKIVESLSRLFIENHLPLLSLDKHKFLIDIAYFVKSFGLQGLFHTLKLIHKLFDHQDSNIMLDCKNLHCIQCYHYFMDIYFYSDPESKLSCTC